MRFLRSNFHLLLLICVVAIFYYPFILKGKLPIPADTIVGMYHPFRDQLKPVFPNGYPFKNFLITDPVRQQYLWRSLAIAEMKKGQLPVWNPYSFSGTLLLANFQTAAFYPLNIIFFILPFALAWSLLILLSSMLTGVFLFLYLRNLAVSKPAALVGSLSFVFSGFSIAWLEWNTINHVVLWLILALLAVDKIKFYFINQKRRRQILWLTVFTISLAMSFLAGHLQIFFYGFLLVLFYLVARLLNMKEQKAKLLGQLVICLLLFAVLTLPQSLPTWRFIVESNRNFDSGRIVSEGFFLPFQNLAQFLAPDFFGNPVTGNYFGVWNYAEFVASVGILGLILSLSALFLLKRKLVLFYFLVFIISLVMATPNFISQLPYKLNFPLITSSQPTRLLFLTSFALSVLAALGFDKLSKLSFKRVLLILNSLGVLFLVLWTMAFLNKSSVSLRNLVLPTMLFMAYFPLIIILGFTKFKKIVPFIFFTLIFLHTFDLLRFSWKFIPFTSPALLYPPTNLLSLIAKDTDIFRVMAIDRRILPPNFSLGYHLQDVSGYDPLYLKSYAQLASSWEQDKADHSPASFNRIITPHFINSFMVDLMNVKYIFSFGPLENNRLSLVDSEGETYLYRNDNFYPRVFLVREAITVSNRAEELNKMFTLRNSLRLTAVVEGDLALENKELSLRERASILSYEPNRIVIAASTDIRRLLVLSDIYSPFWKAEINGKPAEIIPVNYNLRGIIVPPGESTVILKSTLL